MPQLNPIYPEGQLHSKPSEFLFGVQVPLLTQGLAEHTLSVEKSVTFINYHVKIGSVLSR